MAEIQLGARIDKRVKTAVQAACEAKGLKFNRFVEDALIDKLEELVDAKQIAKLRREPARPLEAVLKDLGL